MDNVHFFEEIKALDSYLTEALSRYSKAFVLVDENTKALCLPLLKNALNKVYSIEIKSGEQNKDLASCESIWTALTNHAADRKAVLINLGGGVICDMGGFAVSCYKRGVDFINIPTTLLAMVDASVGGKTGIDFKNLKNQIGLFSHAREVLICSDFLKTLDQRQLRSGIAEVLKHYLIADAQSFIDYSPTQSTIPDIDLIKKAVKIKSQIVSQDPFEKDIRKQLNFGHTIGHALESFSLTTTQPLLHGEAIAYGMAIEIFIAENKSLLASDKAKIAFAKLSIIFNFETLTNDAINDIITNSHQDKKNENGIVKMALIDNIGSCRIDVPVDAKEILQAIACFNNTLTHTL